MDAIEHLDFDLTCQACDGEPHGATYFIEYTCGCTVMMCSGAQYGIRRVSEKMAFKCGVCGASCRVALWVWVHELDS